MNTNVTAAPPALAWVVDPGRSTIAFEVRHLHFAKVDGRFGRFSGRVGADGIEGSVAVASIDTGDPIRDERLRSPDFFDAARFPRITFTATGRLDPLVTGLVTICGVTRAVTFEVDTAIAGEGELRVAATTSISRKDFGLTWSGLVKAGEVVVSDRVEIRLGLVLVPAGAAR